MLIRWDQSNLNKPFCKLVSRLQKQCLHLCVKLVSLLGQVIRNLLWSGNNVQRREMVGFVVVIAMISCEVYDSRLLDTNSSTGTGWETRCARVR